MRKNLPVVDREVKVRDDQMIVSRTDLKGVINYVNKDFLEVSGFSEAELIGAPHNLVRHPDMPAVAFADLWETLQAGRPWTGLVKNRRKDGAYYWVLARATPVVEGGKLTGYLSVRTRPSQQQIDQAEAAYKAVREGRGRHLRVAQGGLASAAWTARAADAWRDSPLLLRAGLLSLPPAVLALLCALTVLGGLPMAGLHTLAVAAGAFAVLQLACLPCLMLGITRPLRQVRAVVRNIAAGDFNSVVDVQRGDELGALQQAISTMQTRLGFEIAEAKRIADENLRVRSALDASSANVMLADADGTIRYLNPAVTRMLSAAQPELRSVLPDFQVDRLVGESFDRFHRNPAHQRNLLAGLTGTHRTQIQVAGRSFALTANPIRNAQGERLGTVVEWLDRTLEVATEQEVSSIVGAAAAGDFSRRLVVEGKQGFHAQLAEGINQLLDINSRGLAEVSGVLGAVAAGDLTRQASGDFQGTFAKLTQDCNLTVERLIAIVRHIREGVEAINIGAREIATGNDDLARRTEEQANALEKTSAALEELTVTVKQNAESAGEASRLAANTSRVAQDGGKVVAEVIETMGSITTSSRKISDIIAVIDGIAFQTNILALNAAVEAARAGDEGRGFAVVAGEVRGLASRSAAAAKEIKALIGDSVSSVESGARLVDAAGRSMAEIVQSVDGVTGIIATIANASREQAIGIEHINSALNQMDETGQQNAALVEQASAAAKSTADQTQRLSQAVAVFRTR